VVGADTQDCFITTTAPASLEPYRGNEHYASDEEFVFALADALRTEYEAIAGAGFAVQVDDAWLLALWDRIGIQMGLERYLRYCALRIDALNHALANVPEERIRYHLCWGSWHGPHAFDLPMKDVVDLMLRVKARTYLFEAANARHEHEQGHRAGVRHSLDRRRRAPGARRATHRALRAARRCGQCDGRRRLRLRRPLPSADRVGEARVARPRRGARAHVIAPFVCGPESFTNGAAAGP
jgi:hypothetical protein